MRALKPSDHATPISNEIRVCLAAPFVLCNIQILALCFFFFVVILAFIFIRIKKFVKTVDFCISNMEKNNLILIAFSLFILFVVFGNCL